MKMDRKGSQKKTKNKINEQRRDKRQAAACLVYCVPPVSPRTAASGPASLHVRR